MTDRQFSVARLAGDLRSMGLGAEATPTGLRLGAAGTSPHVAVTVDDEQLNEYLARGAADVEGLFPDVPLVVGAYRLLLVNLEEYVGAWGSQLRAIEIRHPSLVVHREPVGPSTGGFADHDPDGEFNWYAEPPRA